MQPRLIKVGIPKDTLALRGNVWDWLHAQDRSPLMPSTRCASDALRVATTYVLRRWQTWKGEDGTLYKALAASPTGQRGLVLDVNVQIRKPDGVQYSTTVCRIEAKDAEEPKIITDAGAFEFHELHCALDIAQLLELGTAHLFDQDLRRLCSDLLSDDADTLWPGVWLCLRDGPGLTAIAELGTLVSTGSVTLKTLTLEQSAANRELLAEELAREYCAQFDRLSKRLAYPRPNIVAIEAEYLKLCGKLTAAEELLGVAIPCGTEQINFELALDGAQMEEE